MIGINNDKVSIMTFLLCVLHSSKTIPLYGKRRPHGLYSMELVDGVLPIMYWPLIRLATVVLSNWKSFYTSNIEKVRIRTNRLHRTQPQL